MRASIVGVMALLSCSVSPAFAVTFTTLNVTATSVAHSINDAGVIVGQYNLPSPNNSGNLGYIYSGGAVTNTLGEPFSNTVALGINNAGDVVGGHLADGSGFFYSGGVYTPLNAPGAVGGTVAYDINNAGQVVGSYISDVSNNASSFIYSGGVYTPFNVPGAITTLLTGINDTGQIIGSYYGNDRISHSFLYSGGVYTTLYRPGEEGDVDVWQVWGINNAGQIVGSYGYNGGIRNFLYTNGVYQFLLDNLADIASIAVVQGINDAGQIVGYASYVNGRDDCSCSFVVSLADALGSGDVPVPEVPLPAALPLFAAGLGAMGLLGWRRRNTPVAA